MSRNPLGRPGKPYGQVTSREGRVSRNPVIVVEMVPEIVTSREGRVSRNRKADPPL